MEGRPLIAISTYLEAGVRWGVWDERPAVLVPAGYPELVQAAGGVAVLLPPDHPRHAPAAMARFDGLILSGGPDVDPARYGAVRDPHTGPPAPERDAWELALIDAASARQIPLLGICRGMQLLNVALGGTLLQHLEGHASVSGLFGRHRVSPVPGTRCAGLVPVGADIPTYHHQAVDLLGRDLLASAHAVDGTIEAVELPGAHWVLGVQWHPEVRDGLRVVGGFVQAVASSA
jgi:putative glutamine amidotransferase